LTEAERREHMKSILETTTIFFLPLWMRRIRENFNEILQGRDFKEIPRDPTGSAVIVSGGPSLRKFNLVERLKASGYGGCIIAVDRRLTECIQKGVIPDFMCSCDADQRETALEKFFNWPLIEEHSGKIKGVFGVISPLNVTRKWKGEKYWFLPVLDTTKDPLSVTQVVHHLTMKTIVDTLANVSGLATVLALYLGKNPLAFMGLDLSFPDADKPEDTEYWKDWEHDEKKGIAFSKIHNPLTGRDYLTELRLESYCQLLRNVLNTFEPKPEVWNLSQEGIFFGDNIKWATVEEFVKQHPR